MACRGSGVRVPVAPPDRDEPPTLTPRRRRGVNRLRGTDRDRPAVTETADSRTRIERYDPTAIEPRWQARWAELGLYDTDLRDTTQAQVLPADDVPVSVGRPAHRPLVHRHPDATRWRASGGCTATTCSSRSASMPSACRPRTPPSRTAATRSPGRCRTSRTCAASSGRWARRSPGSTRSSPPTRVLPLEPVAVPALPGGGPGLSQDVAGRLVPQRRDAGARAGRGRRPALLALRRAGREARPGAVVPAHDGLRRRAARLRRHRLARADPDPADELDRPLRGRRDRLRRPRPPTTSRAATSCACSRPGPDTLFGATFMVLAPEHPLVATLTAPGPARRGRRVRRAGPPTDRDRPPVDRPREDRRRASAPTRSTRSTASGSRSSSPTTCWPATARARSWPCPPTTSATSRSRAQFGLPIRRVVAAPGTEADDADGRRLRRPRRRTSAWSTAAGSTGCRPTRAARRSSPTWPPSGQAEPKVTYRLRDWLVSRQRYWGTPIPVVYCERDGIVPVPDEDLPVRLPETVDYQRQRRQPAEPRRGVPATSTCPICGGPARRETDTMDTFVDSSWYWFRYLSPDKDGRPGRPRDDRSLDAGRPVHGRRRARRHAPAVQPLLHQGDGATVGLVGEREPFKRLFNQGQILGADGERMSKSRGNVQDPDELVQRYGADTVRLFLMFMGPWDQGGPWSPTGIGGVHRFLNRVWTLVARSARARARRPDAARCRPARPRRMPRPRIRAAAHRTLRDVTDGLRGVPLQHDGRQADGADQHAVPLPRHGGRRGRRAGTRRSACCC